MIPIGRSLAIVSLSLVTACSTAQLEELRRVQPTGTDYQKILAAYYLTFADQEAANYDWMDSQYFANKGLRAAYGKEVDPEEPQNWRLPDGMQAELTAARQALTKALDFDSIALYPQLSARMVYSYDCWIEQLEESSYPEETDRCRADFYESLEKLTQQKSVAEAEADRNALLRPAPPPAPVPPENPPPPGVTIASSTYLLFFQPNSSALTLEGLRMVRRVVSDIEALRNFQIHVTNPTLATAVTPIDQAIARKRLTNVRTVLRELGIAAEAIYLEGLDEGPPAPTPDNIPPLRIHILLTT